MSPQKLTKKTQPEFGALPKGRVYPAQHKIKGNNFSLTVVQGERLEDVRNIIDSFL